MMENNAENNENYYLLFEFIFKSVQDMSTNCIKVIKIQDNSFKSTDCKKKFKIIPIFSSLKNYYVE
jgi:hypothetical protein